MGKKIEQLKKEIDELRNSFLLNLQVNLKEELLDSAKVKQLLNISDSTLYRMRKRNEIPHKKIGGMYYYPKSFFTTAILQQFNK